MRHESVFENLTSDFRFSKTCYSPGVIPRFVLERLREALVDTPAVLVTGPRQCGKSTLVSTLLEEPVPRRYVTLDDLVALSAAKADPAGFVSGLAGPVCIDEVQRAPELLLPIKAAIDRDRAPGRFLLTGSANVLSLPRVADSLVGRVEIVPLAPLAQAEIAGAGRVPNLVDALFDGIVRVPEGRLTKAELLARVEVGGYPEAVARERPDRRDAWFRSYLSTVLDRDVRDLADIDKIEALPRLLAALFGRSAGLLNYADLSSGLGASQPTVKRYVSILERLFLVQLLPAWARSSSVRLSKTPKVFAVDTGLAAHLLGAGPERLSADAALAGSLTETFVVGELQKMASWSRRQPAASFFRTSDGREVDLVLEDRSGALVGVEVKAAETVSSSDFRGLRAFEELAGDRFRLGVLVYAGPETVAFGERLHALPASALWA